MSASVSVTHLFFPSDGRRGLAVAAVLIRPPNTIELSLLSSNLFPPPGEAYPSDVLSLTISHRMLPEPPQFRVSLLPTRRGDYPSGSVALVSCQDVDAVSRWAPMLAVRMRRSSIRCRESRSPVGCCESLLVGRPKPFLSA